MIITKDVIICCITINHVVNFIEITLLLGSMKGRHILKGCASLVNFVAKVIVIDTIHEHPYMYAIHFKTNDVCLNLVSIGHLTICILAEDKSNKTQGASKLNNNIILKALKQVTLDLHMCS